MSSIPLLWASKTAADDPSDDFTALRKAQRAYYFWFGCSILLATVLQILDTLLPYWQNLHLHGLNVKGCLGLLNYALNAQSTQASLVESCLAGDEVHASAAATSTVSLLPFYRY